MVMNSKRDSTTTTLKNTMANQANFQFYAELNDFLPPWQQNFSKSPSH